ncbi:unnamed protein product [Allacma fusca]|uniref:Uncharacterized protein n=1 Tax=Allacma fusca TaxID=39272 RepID=A0A8J2LDL8_9HEXA|nr:unnamed protein product [Allacma fusca]
MFREKAKRIAHIPKFDKDAAEELRKKCQLAIGPLQATPHRPVASGSIPVGNVLSNARFCRLLENELPNSDTSSRIEDNNCRNGMTLRKRNGSFTYSEYFLIDRYRSEAFYYEMQQLLNKNSSVKTRKKIVATRTWNETPTECDTRRRVSGRTLTWDKFLSYGENICRIAPVHCFKQAPLYNTWSQIAIPGMVVEFRNPFMDAANGLAYWFGSIVYFAGYLALVRLELLKDDLNEKTYLAWVSFCSDEPKPLGWCVENGVELSLGDIWPDETILENVEAELQDFYSQPHETLTSDHYSRIVQEIYRPSSFNPAIPVEVVDVKNLNETRLGKISAQIGDFVHVTLYEDNTYQQGLWLNVNSNLIHPFGWSNAVGVKVNAVPYSVTRDYSLDPHHFQDASPPFEIEEGMRLEMRHPILIFKFVGAVVTQVLKFGHFVVQTMEKCKGTRVQFVVHFRDPLIFPWGWTSNNNLRLDRSRIEGQRPNLRLDLLPERDDHKFVEGMKLEAVDPLNSKFVFPATIQKIAGHMLQLHFDNTEFNEINTFWVDAEYGDIFPAGYAEMVGFKFKGHA